MVYLWRLCLLVFSLVFSDVDVWYSPYKGNSQSFMEICVMRLLFPIFLHVVFNQCART